MNWDALDYFAATVLIGAVVIGTLLAWKLISRPGLRIAASAGVLLLVALVWVQLAVGVVG